MFASTPEPEDQEMIGQDVSETDKELNRLRDDNKTLRRWVDIVHAHLKSSGFDELTAYDSIMALLNRYEDMKAKLSALEEIGALSDPFQWTQEQFERYKRFTAQEGCSGQPPVDHEQPSETSTLFDVDVSIQNDHIEYHHPSRLPGNVEIVRRKNEITIRLIRSTES